MKSADSWTADGENRYWRGNAVVQIFRDAVEYRLLDLRRRFVMPIQRISPTQIVAVERDLREWPRGSDTSLRVSAETRDSTIDAIRGALASSGQSLTIVQQRAFHGPENPASSLTNLGSYLRALSFALRDVGDDKSADRAFEILRGSSTSGEAIFEAEKLLSRVWWRTFTNPRRREFAQLPSVRRMLKKNRKR